MMIKPAGFALQAIGLLLFTIGIGLGPSRDGGAEAMLIGIVLLVLGGVKARQRISHKVEVQQPISGTPSQIPQANSAALKKCPFCAEEIKAEAVVCRYCSRDLPKS